MEHLTTDQLARLRARLEEERERLVRRDEVQRTFAPANGTQPDVGDQQDAAAVEAAHVTELSLQDHDRARLREVDEALHRMQLGTYGVCEDTDEEIPFERLWAEPTARLTVAAKELREREAGERADLRLAY